MSLTALIRKRVTGNLATAIPAIPATQAGRGLAAVARLATIAIANPEVAPSDPATEARRQRVLTILADNPALRLAVVCDGAGDPVPVAVAIRDKGSVEVLIPAARFDPFALLALIDKHTASETLQ